MKCSMVMKWIKLNKDNSNLPAPCKRILCFFEVFKNEPAMAYRIIDSQFILTCSDVTHYVYLHPPEILSKERIRK